MNTFIDFTSSDLEDDIDSFAHEYALADPNGSDDSFSVLYSNFQNLLFECKYLTHTYGMDANSKLNSSSFKTPRLTWLLCNVTFTDFYAQLQSFMIKLDNPNLSSMDYVLLFYISLQSVEVQDVTRNLPLSMLHDMFSPVAEDNLAKWKLSTQSLF
jgi:hypothetical protein